VRWYLALLCGPYAARQDRRHWRGVALSIPTRLNDCTVGHDSLPVDVRDALFAIFPEFRIHWEGDDNAYIDGNGGRLSREEYTSSTSPHSLASSAVMK
jgi:hypothetical protein